MTLVDLHTHFDWNEAVFLHLETYDEERQEFRHCVYRKDDRRTTVPKIEGDIPPEAIEIACNWLRIPLPIAVEAALERARNNG
jgi:hypothetical protein